MIEVERLCKTYDGVEALKEVSFKINTGEVIGLLGPNGAGKTTLMKIVTGFLHPSSGRVRVGGLDVCKETGRVQEMIGYLPENAPLYPELTVQSHLRMIADLRLIPKDKQRHYISDAVYAVGLSERLNRPISTLSKGYRQRLGLAQAILHKPRLLILDEPTNGLDPSQIVEVRALIKRLSKQSTILLSTHILPEVEATCDRVIMIIQGTLKANASLSELAATNNSHLTLARGPDPQGVIQELQGLPEVAGAAILREDDQEVVFTIQGSGSRNLGADIFQLAKTKDWPLRELRKEVKTLESVFNELTR